MIEPFIYCSRRSVSKYETDIIYNERDGSRRKGGLGLTQQGTTNTMPNVLFYDVSDINHISGSVTESYLANSRWRCSGTSFFYYNSNHSTVKALNSFFTRS